MPPPAPASPPQPLPPLIVRLLKVTITACTDHDGVRPVPRASNVAVGEPVKSQVLRHPKLPAHVPLINKVLPGDAAVIAACKLSLPNGAQFTVVAADAPSAPIAASTARAVTSTPNTASCRRKISSPFDRPTPAAERNRSPAVAAVHLRPNAPALVRGSWSRDLFGQTRGQHDPPRSGETGEAGTGDCHGVASLAREYLEVAARGQ